MLASRAMNTPSLSVCPCCSRSPNTPTAAPGGLPQRKANRWPTLSCCCECKSEREGDGRRACLCREKMTKHKGPASTCILRNHHPPSFPCRRKGGNGEGKLASTHQNNASRDATTQNGLLPHFYSLFRAAADRVPTYLTSLALDVG